VLTNSRQIYPPEREALGVVAIGIELVDPPGKQFMATAAESAQCGVWRQRMAPVASKPPSTRIVSPVIHEAASDTRNATSWATSSGKPSRAIG
jgi:hypothetical protein